jgi:hypothetical protein
MLPRDSRDTKDQDPRQLRDAGGFVGLEDREPATSWANVTPGVNAGCIYMFFSKSVIRVDPIPSSIPPFFPG